jgi:hypothetical protein
MHTFIQIIRWFFGIILILAFVLFLSIGLPFSATMKVMTDKQNPKNWLSNADVYSKFSSDIVTIGVDQIKKQDTEGRNFIPDAELTQILSTAFSAGWIQGEVEKNIDQLYDWLKNQDKNLVLTVDLSKNDAVLKSQLADSLKKQFALLPKCATIQNSTNYYDYLGKKCLPSQVSLQEVNTFINNNTNSTQIWKNPVIALDQNAINPDLTESLQNSYNIGANAYLWFWGITTAFCILIILLIPGWTKGFVILGILMLISSGIWIGGTYLGSSIFDNIFNQFSTKVQGQLQLGDFQNIKSDIVDNLLRNGALQAFNNILNEIRTMSLYLVISAIVFIIIGIIIRWRKKKREITAKNIQIQHSS